jgi:hypothetical protein
LCPDLFADLVAYFVADLVRPVSHPFTPIFDIMLIPFRFSPVAIAVAAAVASIASVASVSSAYAQTEVVKPASAEEAAKTPSVPPSKKRMRRLKRTCRK